MTLLLIYAGGFTTTIKAGMVFADWPLSNGSLNPPGWTSNLAMLAEHSHRLLGMTVGLLTLLTALAAWRWETRRWVRRLAWGALGLVVLQGLLGGLRVLGNSVFMAGVHGLTGQVVLCALATLGAVQTRAWAKAAEPADPARRAGARRWGAAVLLLSFAQLLLGVVMRHREAGLAIPTYPLTPEHTLLPAVWTVDVALHFAHRHLPLALGAALAGWIAAARRDASLWRAARPWAAAAGGLFLLQFALGVSILWTARMAVPTTVHVLNGAIFLSTVWIFLLWHWRESLPPAGRSAN